MASTNQKPLPSIPQWTTIPRNLTNLTVEGRDHLRKLIHSALAEGDHLNLTEGERESWANALESTLDVLGDNIAQDGWLNGVKAARMMQKAKKAEEMKKLEAKKVTKEQEDATKSKGNGKNDIMESEAPRREDKELPNNPPTSTKTDNQAEVALRQIRELLASPTPAAPQLSAKLLLCIAPINKDIPTEDSGFDVVPDSTGCVFTPGFFSLPEASSDKTASGILFGLDEWNGLYSTSCLCVQYLNHRNLVNTFSSDDDSIKVIGGSFVFTGVASPTEHNVLSKVLRIAIYVYLSLMLEQHFLSDSNVALKLSKPRASPINPPFVAHATIDVPPSSLAPKKKPRSSLLPSSIVSFFSKKTESLLQRTAGIAPNLGRTISLELKPSSSRGLSPRSSQDKIFGRLRRFSITSDSRSPLSKPSQAEVDAADTPFASTLKRLEGSRDVLSSSPGISLAPPSLIVALAAKEAKDSSRRLLANENTSLKSILGWDGGRTQGEGMTGTLGFVRQQGFSVLHSRLVPSTPPQPPDLPSSSLSSSSQLKLPVSAFSPCEKARWITYTYYSRDSRSDKTLGDAIVDLCSAADKPCDKSGCQFKRGQHELRFIHGGLRIILKVEPRDIDVGTSHDDAVTMWQTCKICNAQSRRNRMSDGT